MLKNFRAKHASNIAIKPSEYDKKVFTKYEQKFFNVSPFQKIITLLEKSGKVYHNLAQGLFAKIDIASIFFELDVCVRIQAFLDGHLQISYEKFFQQYTQEIERRHKEIDQYYVLIAELELLSRLIETKIVSIKDIEQFRKLPEVEASLNRMNQLYKKTKKA
ncbi:hypothetical protein KAI19_02840 [bacterium]|nr:hypothetical protein [bacterium]